MEKSNDTLLGKVEMLYKVSGTAAIICSMMLLISAINIVTRNGILGFTNNWLITLYKLHAGYDGYNSGLLKGFNWIDAGILAMTGITFLIFFFLLKEKGRVLAIFAIVQPFLGIILLISTQLAGRSAVMGGLLVLSIALIRSNIFGNVITFGGLAASILLLAGDVSEGMVHSKIIAGLIVFGYVLLIVWFFVMGLNLLRKR